MEKFILISFLYIVSTTEETEDEYFLQDADFIKLVESPAFVDKSMFLKNIFSEQKGKLITAPPGFGKTINLNMIEHFLAINNDDKMKVHLRKTFQQLEIYKNKRHFFNRHFGKYPVVFVDFAVECYNIFSFEDIISKYKFHLHTAYVRHKYLMNSSILNEDDKMLLTKWCGSYSFEELTEQRVRTGLYQLVDMLRIHYDKKVVVLIDNYDSVISSAMHAFANEFVLQKLIALTSDIIISVVKNNNVLIALITGISYISGYGLSEAYIQHYKFLDDHNLIRFYGFTMEEVNNLFNREIFKLDKTFINKTNVLCEGYTDKTGQTIFYNMVKILKYLHMREAFKYKVHSSQETNLLYLFRFPEVEHKMDVLLHGASINITVIDKLNLKHIISLRDMYSLEHVQPNTDLLFSYLLDLGYFTYVNASTNDDVIKVKLTNNEIRDYIFKEFKEHFIVKYNISRDSVRSASYAALKNILLKKNLNRFSKINVKCSTKCTTSQPKRLKIKSTTESIPTIAGKLMEIFKPIWLSVKKYLHT